MGALLRRVAQVAVEEEGTEGTAEVLVAADATLSVYNPTFSIDIANFQRDPARATLSKLQGIKGIKTARIGFRVEAKGSGAVATLPSWDDAIRACGFQRSAVSRIGIGAVSGGPFQPLETITGGTSAATGRVVSEISNGAAYLYFVVLTGTFQSGEVITGSVSAATATSSSVVGSNQGYEYTPDSSGVISATLAVYMDGVRHTIYGARGNVKFGSKVGEPQFMDFDFQGVYGGTTDTAVLSGITYETTIPPTFLAVGLAVQGLSAVFSGLNFDIKNTLTPRTNANSTNGVLSVMITDREPSGSIDAEMPTVASHDVYGKLSSGAVGRFYYKIGDTAGNILAFGSPCLQYQGVGDGDRGGIKLSDIDFGLYDRNINVIDNELQIAMI